MKVLLFMIVISKPLGISKLVFPTPTPFQGCLKHVLRQTLEISSYDSSTHNTQKKKKSTVCSECVQSVCGHCEKGSVGCK